MSITDLCTFYMTPEFLSVLRRWAAADIDDRQTNAEVVEHLVAQGECAEGDEIKLICHSDEGLYCIANNLTSGECSAYCIADSDDVWESALSEARAEGRDYCYITDF